MASQNHVLLFPNEQTDLLGTLHKLSVRSRTQPKLRTFLTEAAAAIRRHVEGLNIDERQRIGEFEDVVELAERHVTQEVPSVIVELVLFTTAQIGDLLVNVDNIVSLGLEAVVVGFHLAVELQRIGKDIEDSNGTWAREIPNFTEELEQQLETFNSTRPPLHRAYIGQTTPVDAVLYSAHSSTAYQSGGSLSELWGRTIAEIAHKPINIEETAQAVAETLKETHSSNVILTTIGSTWDSSVVQHIFQQYGQVVTINEPTPCPMPWGDDVSSISPDAIAVVGMSGRFPDSDTLDELWRLLESGTTTHQEIPSSRFNIDDFYDPSRETHNALLTRFGCFLKNPGDFDHRLFNISPREALQMDPVQRILLMTTYEALEMAGYSPSSAKGQQSPPRIATYFGQTVDDWKTINEQQGIDTHYLPGVNRSFAPGRLAHYFQWAGGFYSIDTGCSSSATGLCLARDALASGQCDAAVVGGGTLLNAPEWFAGLSQGGFLSPTGACKTYSDSADGYCRGEGVGVVILKRLSDAVRSKDNVLAVLAGAARNCNAGAGSITYPGEKAQETLYRKVLRQAGIRPHDVGYVEMHGTGTQAGDKVETAAVQKVFARPTPLEPRRAQALIIGAVKANLGHSEAAAGIISMIKAVLVLQRNMIPPQPNQPLSLNPHVKPILDSGDVQLASGQAWKRNGTTPRYLVTNNFDASGGNISFVVHDTPSFALPPPSTPDERAHHVVVTSGRTLSAHDANKSRLRKYLLQHPETQLADLAYTTTARRMHQVHRAAYVTSSTADLLKQLEKPTLELAPEQAKSVVFAFTGQGAQHMGMGGMLYRTSATFKRLLDSYQNLCDAQGLECQFIDAIRETEQSITVDATTAGVILQVATVALEISLTKYWQSLGIQPTLLIGHSLGEYAALCIAGVLSVGDALALVYERATLIAKHCSPSDSTMLAVSLPASTVQWRLRDSAATAGCEISCYNGPSSTVVGGSVPAIEALESYLNSEGHSTATRLRVQYAFHTRQMDPMLDDLEKCASQVKFHPPTLPVASTLLGRIVKPGEDGVFSANYLRRHTREPVAFVEAIRACEREGLIDNQSLVLECGPHSVCIGLMASSLQEAKPSSYPSLRRRRDDWESISQCLAAAHRAQLSVSWADFHRDHFDHLRLISDLPTYAFDLKSFWFSYDTKRAPNKTPNVIQSASQSGVTRLSSASLNSVRQIRKEGSHILATFAADLSDPHLARAIGGHVVDGVAICPASVFIDMAYTAAAYLEKESSNISNTNLATYDLTNLSMRNPLVLRGSDNDPTLALVEGDLDQSTAMVSIRFLSAEKGAASSSEYGSCSIRLGQPIETCIRDWSRIQPLVKSRLSALVSSSPKEVHRMNKALFYKLFSEIVDYSGQFHGVDEATLAMDFHDAFIVLQVDLNKELGTFTCNPFAVDTIVHVAGFLLNADVRKPKSEIHIANHIGSLRVLDDLSRGPYRAYAMIREQDTKTGTSLCDVYVTDSNDKLATVCTDICFKKLERDSFALLTGSARALPPKRQSKASPRREWQHAKSSGSSDSPSTPASEPSYASSSSSISVVVNLSAELFDIIAARSGVSVAELTSSTNMTFSELGVDSQMSIAILADFQKATSVELPAAFFTNFPTPAAVEKELGSQEVEDKTESERTTKPDSVSTPKRKSRTRTQSQAKPHPSEALFNLIADALGLNASDLTPSTTFESIGMDSMLSIKILSQFQNDTDIELPAAFFTENKTVAAVKKELDEPAGEEVPQRPSLAKEPNLAVAPSAPTSARQQKIDTALSRAVLIQGQSKSRSAPLFLTTDGSGTVESYIHLSALPAGRRIYALESPFLGNPSAFDLSIVEMATIFLRTIRRIQPHGPYLIGGWSAGSIYAYEVAHSLTRQGEEIAALVILDMRAPSLSPPSLSATSIVTTYFVDRLDTFEGINRARDLPEDLSVQERDHLMATCRALFAYNAPPFPIDRRPHHVAVVWAKLGLDNRPDAPIAAMGRPGQDIGKRMDEMSLDELERYFNLWFYGRREMFGMNGWEDFVGENIDVVVVDGGKFPLCVM
ncbi:putative Conidial yellow pigment biosynthesis polyketide synthase [Glarea lozoyensis 74030]|uniref:Putative Conidial yellow pigment biosynthesis polyketide synthase n=1 Tax=Glarea lozoyensis (strain ATCC 74030 / MF5533) TaxID=1104152 RepID=H0EV44_GLAL7|nr:putative Conidial yellow pigment biosynthesis polyketide synthase [Glarea lozoyensis 74030]